MGEPALGSRGGYPGDPDSSHEARHSERAQQEPGYPRPLVYYVKEDAPRPGPGEDREERPHLQYPVAPGESIVRQDFGKDSVLGRAEERALRSHECEDCESHDTTGGFEPEREGPTDHEHDLDRLHRYDDRALAEPIGEDARGKRKQHERKREGDKR